jgi:hypothetical protein
MTPNDTNTGVLVVGQFDYGISARSFRYAFATLQKAFGMNSGWNARSICQTDSQILSYCPGNRTIP